MSQEERDTAYYNRSAPGSVKLPNGETDGLQHHEIPGSPLAEIGHSQIPLLKVIRASSCVTSHAQPKSDRG